MDEKRKCASFVPFADGRESIRDVKSDKWHSRVNTVNKPTRAEKHKRSHWKERWNDIILIQTCHHLRSEAPLFIPPPPYAALQGEEDATRQAHLRNLFTRQLGGGREGGRGGEGLRLADPTSDCSCQTSSSQIVLALASEGDGECEASWASCRWCSSGDERRHRTRFGSKSTREPDASGALAGRHVSETPARFTDSLQSAGGFKSSRS